MSDLEKTLILILAGLAGYILFLTLRFVVFWVLDFAAEVYHSSKKQNGKPH
jgi:hypothetical protein